MYYKIAHGAKWLLLFHQIWSDASMSIEEAKFSNSSGKYSILGYLTDMGKYKNAYEFLLEYPESNLDYIQWRQTVNPIASPETSLEPSSLGTEIKHCTHDDFRGLALSTNSRAYLDGDGRVLDDFWYCIGYLGNWDGEKIPGPHPNSVDQTMLWLRVPWERTCHGHSFSIRSFFMYVSIFITINTNA